MPQPLDPLGVRALWEDAGFQAGYQGYIRSLQQANKATTNLARQGEASYQKVGQASKKMSDTVVKSTKQATDGTRDFIKSISGIYAVFRLGPQMVQQFGNALRDAAAGQAVQDAFDTLSKNVGVNADLLIANMQRASRGTIEQIELMRVANRAMLAGGREFAQELPRLFEIARAASIATGKDIRWVFDTLVTGIARSSVKLIDNAEIYIKVGRVVDQYAKSQGKATEELSASERQMVILNAVLDQGVNALQQVGADTEVATDEFDRYTASMNDATQNTLSFLNDAIGPLGPALKVTGDLLMQIAPLLQTIALLKLAGAGSVLVSLKGLVAPLSALAAPLAGVTAGVLAYNEGIRKLNEDLPTAGSTISMTADVVQYAARSFLDGKEAADEWFRSVNANLPEFRAIAEAEDAARKELDEFNVSLGFGVDAYGKYIVKVNELNAELVRGEEAISAATYWQWQFNRAFEMGQASIEEQIKLLQEYREWVLKSGNVLEKATYLADALGLALTEAALIERKAMEDAAAAAERRKKMMEALAPAIEAMHEKVRKAVDALNKEQSKVLKAQEDFSRDMERLAEDLAVRLERINIDHARKVADIYQDAARDRIDARRDYYRDLEDAEVGRLREIEDAHRRHRFRLEDIELNYRRRIQDIEERYSRTVREAAIERDALAIIKARERRAAELTDAERDREDARRREDRSLQESLRQVEWNYQERIRQAKVALQRELEDIQINLQRKLEDEHINWQRRLEDARRAYARRLADLQRANKAEEAEDRRSYNQRLADLNRFLAQWNRARARLRPIRRHGPGGSRGTRGVRGTGDETYGQHGFDGVVTGPHTFHVESGVREYVHMSGDLGGGRQSVPASPGAAQTQQLRAAVGGAVNVGLEGFSTGLMNRLGLGISDMVGQAIIDEFAAALERAL
jgi:hypothetical protein